MGILDAPAVPLIEKGAALGVATLDISGKVTISQIPNLAINDLFPVNSQAEMLALTAQRGDMALRTDLVPNQTFVLAADTPTVLSAWKQITLANVSSVAGKTGVVALDVADVSGAAALADVVLTGTAGLRLTSSPSAPSNPAIGDIWIDLDDVPPPGSTGSSAPSGPLTSSATFGTVGDQVQPGTTITLTAGNPVAAMAVVPGTPPKVGQTLVTATAGNYLVTAISGVNVTLSPIPSVSGSMKFHYGTDNTVAFNAFFVGLTASKMAGFVPSGRYLITGTIGVLEPGFTLGQHGLTVYWGGGGGVYIGRQSSMGLFSGCALVWGGATDGMMMQLSRVLFPRFVGALVYVGQQSYDLGGVLTYWGPKAGLSFHLSQSGLPTVGTGYLSADDMIFDGGKQAMQFGTNQTDNNSDTSLFNRLVFWHIDNGLRIKHTQGLAYRINWLQSVSVPGYTVKTDDGGALEFGSVHLNNCGTASADPTADTYALDFSSSINGYLFKIALLRVENGCKRVLATRSDTISVNIGLFSETNTVNADDCLFYLAGGRVKISGGYLNSFKVAGRAPIYLRRSAAGKQPRISLEEMQLPTDSWAALFDYADDGLSGTAVAADISVMKCRDAGNVSIAERHSRAERGRVVTGNNTSDATTSTRLDPKMGLGPGTSVEGYSQGVRVPVGMALYEVTIMCDHTDGTGSVFRRLVQTTRSAAGTSSVVNTQVLGTDIVAGTDQIFAWNLSSLTLSALSVNVKGTAGVPGRWRAEFRLLSQYSSNPDF